MPLTHSLHNSFTCQEIMAPLSHLVCLLHTNAVMYYIFLLPQIPNSFSKHTCVLKNNLEYSVFNHAHLHVCIKRAQITCPVWSNWTNTEYYWCILILIWLILFKGSLYLGAKHTFTCIFCLLPACDRTFCRSIILSDALHLVFTYTISCDSRQPITHCCCNLSRVKVHTF